MGRRLKVLVSAYACSPRRGSEAGVGWGWVEAISRHHDLWVITGDEEPFPDGVYRYREEIEDELAGRQELRRRLQFCYLHKKRCMGLERVWPPSYLWFYRAWERRAFRRAQKLHAEIGFDLVHQLTYVGYRVPGYLWGLNLPFVWGPIGGLANTPWRLVAMLGVRGAAYYACRNIVNSLHKRFLRRPRRAFRKASGGIIAATEGIRREIRRFYGEDSDVICEVGPPGPIAATHSIRQNGEALRICWSGQHLSGKALPLLLRAVAGLPEGVMWKLDVLGEGPCSGKWRRLARRFELDGRCRWHGWLPHDRAVALMQDAHVFVITSVKDLTSTVLVEALSQGVPVVCLDHCGFSDAITGECGIKIPIRSAKRMAQDMAGAFEDLWADEQRRRKLADGALARAEVFSWDRKGALVDRIYRRVLARAAGAHR